MTCVLRHMSHEKQQGLTGNLGVQTAAWWNPKGGASIMSSQLRYRICCLFGRDLKETLKVRIEPCCCGFAIFTSCVFEPPNGPNISIRPNHSNHRFTIVHRPQPFLGTRDSLSIEVWDIVKVNRPSAPGEGFRELSKLEFVLISACYRYQLAEIIES